MLQPFLFIYVILSLKRCLDSFPKPMDKFAAVFLCLSFLNIKNISFIIQCKTGLRFDFEHNLPDEEEHITSNGFGYELKG
jgi:D-alanyl-lipoteichoic acid acyltransferase DltB (MBOAT superfamily)